MTELLTAMSIIFVVAGALLLVAHLFRLATVPFLILAGILVGPLIDEASVLELAQWGIAFLVFTFAVNLELDSIRRILADSEITAVIQFIAVAGIGFGVGIALGWDPVNAGYLAVAAGLSSTIVGTALLQQERRADLVHARLSESVHFIQDLLAVLLILVISAEAFTISAIGERLIVGIGLLVLAFIISAFAFDYLLRLAEGSQELLLISSISILIGFLAIAELTGLSIVVGAFAAGLAIKRDFTRNLGMLNGVQSIHDFFVAIFFVTIGALVTVPSLEVALTAMALILLTLVIKPLVTIAILIAAGYDARSATFTSLNLDQVSEFALIIAIEALLLGFLARGLFEAIALAAAVTMITSSLTYRHQERMYRALNRLGIDRALDRKIDQRSNVREGLDDHVIVIGYGRIGRLLSESLDTAGVQYVVIENDPGRIGRLEEAVDNFIYGDVVHDYTWSVANVDEARLIVSTPDVPAISEQAIAVAGSTDVIVRASTAAQAESYLAAGATYTIIADILAGNQLVDLLEGILDDRYDPVELREAHLELLEELREEGYRSLDDHVPSQT